MTEVIARIKIKGKNYETLVNIDKALRFKKQGDVGIDEVLSIEDIFYDSKKGLHASESDLEEAFGTSDIRKAAEKIIKQGEIQVPKEHRDKERESKKKQIIDFLSKQAVDPSTGTPITPSRIENAINQAGVNIDNRPVEQQVIKILEKIKKIIPMKIQSKKISIQIPSEHTGKVYGLLQEHKEKEEWLSNGDLKCIVNVPQGLLDDFYDKLNSITHGSVLSQEIKGEE